MTPERRRLEYARFGKRGEWCRVYPDHALGLVRVQWKQRGQKIKTDSWPETREGKREALSFAAGVWERITAGAPGREKNLTLLELWQLYASDQFGHLRARSKKLYEEQFLFWRLFLGDHYVAERATTQTVAAFRAELEAKGLGVRYAREIVATVKRVYRWAESQDHIGRNKVDLYSFKVAKEKRPTSPDEYRADEFERILSQFDPASATQWRAWCALVLCGTQGARQNAVLHLSTTDVRLGHAIVTAGGEWRWIAGEITWRSEWDKNGREWTQPLRIPAQMAIEVALEWRERAGYVGPWLFYPATVNNKRAVWSPQSLWWALTHAEKRADVEHKDRRGAHGLRRLLAGEVWGLTGNFLLGLRAIGDTDPRRAAEYLKTRQDDVAEAFATLDGRGGGDD